MKPKGFFMLKIVLLAVLIVILYGLFTAFDPEYETVEIKQNIGGVLICNSVFSADQHTWNIEVDYTYKLPNDTLINIGYGYYHAREWKKDEQLLKYKDWIILKTGNWIGSDKIIIGKLKANDWTEYIISPDEIEKDEIWISKNIKSFRNYCCAEAYVQSIKNGIIEVNYKFRTDENLTNQYGNKKIFYQIGEQTGKPIMVRIE
jgi:hypothetical protein